MIGFQALANDLHGAKYRPDIDGLRAIAVLSVVIAHAFPAVLPGGVVGVDIFFVISGYLITSILLADIDRQRFSLLGFYDRRIRRIFPALILVLIASLLIGWLILFPSEFRTLGRHVAASTLFSENFLLWSESGYFDADAQHKPLLHLWSLAIEEQFYIIWPVLLYAATRLRVSLIGLILVLFVLSFAVNLQDIEHDPASAYFSPLGRFWELLVGAALACLETRHPRLLASYKQLQSISGAVMLVMAIGLTDPLDHFPGYKALYPTIGAMLLISAGPKAWINSRVLGLQPFVWCGLISYPLYLWHWPLLSAAFIWYGNPPLPVLFGLVAFAILASVLTFLFIERPFRLRVSGYDRALVLAAAMAVVLALGANVVLQVLSPRLYARDLPNRTEWDYLKERSTNFDANGIGIYDLHADRPELALFIGDSHLAQYAERIDTVIATDPNRLGAVMAVGGGCVPIVGIMTDEVVRQDCWAMRDKAYQLAQDKRFSTIVLGGYWAMYFDIGIYHVAKGEQKLYLAKPEGRAAALALLQQQISTFVAAGKKVYLLLDNPASPDFKSTALVSRISAAEPIFQAGSAVAIDPALQSLQHSVADAARRAGAVIIDPYERLCKDARCTAIDETGLPVYQDDNHLNPDWVRLHADYLDVTTLR